MKLPHWLRCDWGLWSEPFEVAGKSSVLGEIVMTYQKRTCGVCNAVQECEVEVLK